MAIQVTKISNPLTLIAVFAGLAEIVATVVLPSLDIAVQNTFVWFVMLFPALLVVLFFVTLNFNNRVLYAPSDYSDETNFLKTLVGEAPALVEPYMAQSSAGAALRRFWKPGDKVDKVNEAKLRAWMKDHQLADTPVTMFLFRHEFATLRDKAIADLDLT